jgi:RalA-binding protein 1
MCFIAPMEESASDCDSILEEDSGTETTDNDAIHESSGSSAPESLERHIRVTAPDTRTQSHRPSKASQVAATRGLNLELSKRGNRHSRIVGLPNSPRPGHSPGPQQSHHLSPPSPLGQLQTPTQTKMER